MVTKMVETEKKDIKENQDNIDTIEQTEHEQLSENAQESLDEKPKKENDNNNNNKNDENNDSEEHETPIEDDMQEEKKPEFYYDSDKLDSKEVEKAKNEKIIKLANENKTLVIGFTATLSAIKKDKLSTVLVASHIPNVMQDEIKHYANLTNVEVKQLSFDNEALGILCKKQYLISTVGIKSE